MRRLSTDLPKDTPPAHSLGDKIADGALRAVISAFKLMPWEKRVPAMGNFVRRVIGPISGYRARAEANLAMVYPDMTAQDRRRIANGVLDNFGRTLIENYCFEEFSARTDTLRVSGPGLDHLAQARAQSRPVLFVTGHFGNHEAPRQVLNQMGHDVGGLYRPMRNKLTNEHYARTMTELSGPVFAQGRRGTLGFAKHLREGGLGTLLFDVRDTAGTLIPFLGHPAWTATSTADLALKFDALVIPYFGIRQPDGLSFETAFEAPIPLTDPVTMVTEMNARLEARINDNPDQWFWVHRRWKSAGMLKAKG